MLSASTSTADGGGWGGWATLLFFLASVVLVVLLQVVTAQSGGDGAAAASASVDRGSLHIRRRLQHSFTGIVFWALSYVIPPFTGAIMLLIGATALGAFHVARLRSDAAQELYLRLFGSLLRPHEKHGLPGAFFFLLGTASVTLLCPIDEARLAVLCLSLGDPAAAVVGTSFGGPKFAKHASLGGCLACFGFSFCLGLLLGFSWKAAGIASTAATVAEALGGIIRIDDNLLIPLSVGFALRISEE